MMRFLQKYKQPIFYWLLFMLAIVLSFPRYSLSSQFIIAFAFVGLFLMNNYNEKKQLLEQNKWTFFSIAIFFLLALMGSIYTNNNDRAILEIILKLPFVILPLVLLSVPLKQNVFEQVYKYFSYGVVVSSLSALLKALYFKYRHWGDYLFYHEFELFIGKHATYFALFLVLALLFFYKQLISNKKNRVINILAIVFLLFMLYVVSNRISLISILLGAMVMTFPKLHLKTRIAFTILLVIGFFMMINTPSFQKRFSPNYLKSKKLNEFDLRKTHILSVIETIAENNTFFGVGTGGNRDALYKKYKQNNYHDAYVFKYNAHNQLLEMGIDFGILGILGFLIALLYQFKIILQSKNYYLLAVYISILTFMLTESILERQSGIIIFSLFVSLIMIQAKKGIMEK